VSVPRLEGKVAIVTGGGRGMGRAMALGLAAAGAAVVITAAREQPEIEQVAAQARAAEHRILPVAADVTREKDCAAVVDAALSAFGRIDILVNNAGRGMKYINTSFMTEGMPFWQADPEMWRTIIDTNVNGPFLMSRTVVPHMLPAGWGRIINLSMNRATMRRAGFSPYGPSKAALESETAIWAQDLQGTGITVNALLPGGATDTGMIPPCVSDEFRRQLLPPEIVVPPLLWLASDESGAVTGKRIIATAWRTDPQTGAVDPTALEDSGCA